MDIIDTLCTLLNEKKNLLLKYEKVTGEILGCDADSVKQYITQRERLANDIDEKSEEIARTCADSPAADLLIDAAWARVDFEKVPGEFQSVFYAGQAVRSVIGRIAEADKQGMEHLKYLRDKALEGVKAHKDVPKIKRYLTDLTEQPVQGGLRDEKV